jgi:energy-coupling factor transporter ATP-binding protein EcfA2
MESFTIPFQLATDFVVATNRAVFLTGKAGTGKTTFLRQIKQHTHKQTAVVAPTGVAAINAGGSTIHSFFQLPFNPYLPEKQSGIATTSVAGKSELISRIKITSNRKKIFQELELLIIDEISMVRCDTLDAIDVILRHFRYRPNEPFGGVQLLLIGDMFQLSPVAVGREWSELSQYYKSPYFFHSRVIMQQSPIYIELDKIYRQNNDDFIEVLNAVRNNNLSPEGYALLQKRYDPHFKPAKDENYITLSTHNYIADEINANELASVPGVVEVFKATIKGEYPEKNYPLDSELKLKVGAKVMFIKNDLEKEKRYYNGKIGTITLIDKDSILVQCPGDPEPISVNQYLWENIKYDVDSKTHSIEEVVIGTFQQYPLRLAWAITIHKSQGLTFEKAIIDAGKAFAPGQVYVALSRCTSLEGLVLSHCRS